MLTEITASPSSRGVLVVFDEAPAPQRLIDLLKKDPAPAYDQHAVRTSEANPLNYLLKPFSDEQWKAALGRGFLRRLRRALADFRG